MLCMKISERALGRWGVSLGLGVEFYGLAERAGQRLEPALGDVVAVLAVESLQMHAGAGVHRERVVKFLEQLGVHLADLRAREGDLPDQVGAVGEVERA